MKPRIKRTIFALCVILVTAVIAGGWYLSNTLPIGTGHVAKTICSNVFISKRNPETVFREDIAPVHFLFAITKFDVNQDRKISDFNIVRVFRNEGDIPGRVRLYGCGRYRGSGIAPPNLHERSTKGI